MRGAKPQGCRGVSVRICRMFELKMFTRLGNTQALVVLDVLVCREEECFCDVIV
jgi:hypothetical protein